MTLEEMESKSGVLREIREHVRRRGLPEHLNPDMEVPVLPHDITVLSTDELMENMSIYDALKTHAQFLHSTADTLTNTREAKLKLTRAQKYLAMKDEMTYQDKRVTIPEMEALLDADEELMRLKHDSILTTGYSKMLKAMAEGFESKFNLLSRELTRRTSKPV